MGEEIQFDRPLNPGEDGYYQCTKCKAYLHPDIIMQHQCPGFMLALSQRD